MNALSLLCYSGMVLSILAVLFVPRAGRKPAMVRKPAGNARIGDTTSRAPGIR
jgi:hypothetical protein